MSGPQHAQPSASLAAAGLRAVAMGDFNVDPAVWGPPLWSSIHTLALKADSDGHEGLVAFKEFLNSLTFLLPCNNCRHDYSKYCSTNPPPEAYDCFGWTVRLHNFVNRRLGKSGEPVTEAAAREIWTSRACNYNCTAGGVVPVGTGEPSTGGPSGAMRGPSTVGTSSANGMAFALFYILIGALVVAALYEFKIRRKTK